LEDAGEKARRAHLLSKNDQTRFTKGEDEVEKEKEG